MNVDFGNALAIKTAMAATDVGDLGATLELFDHAIEGRQPLLHEMVVISGPEETGDRAEQAAGLIAPGHALAGLEGCLHLRLIIEEGGHHVKPPIM
jgi:hypothetical protein